MEESSRPTDPQKTTFNILFVCTGNTCRSPLAEVLACAELERRGWHHVRIGSAGIAAHEGDAASEYAVEVARRRGLDIAEHRSRSLTPELVDWADLVLGMSPSHLWAVEQLGGEDRATLLSDFAAGHEGGAHAIPDPFGLDAAAYEETIGELDRLIRAALDRLAPILHP
jgi:protein-tyrosine phosphatase